jgi:hypothetical protein
MDTDPIPELAPSTFPKGGPLALDTDLHPRNVLAPLILESIAYKQMEVVPTSTGIEAESPLVEE